MSITIPCLTELQAKRILELQETQQSHYLKIQQKQELIALYSKLVEMYDSIDGGIKYYFMMKLQTLVIKLTTPSSILSDRSIISKLKKTSFSSSFLIKNSSKNHSRENGSMLFNQTDRISDRIEKNIQEIDIIQNQYKILEQIQEHKQQTIKSSLNNQQQLIAKRLKERKNKFRRKSVEKFNNILSASSPLINKQQLKKMQKDLNKKIKRMTARLSQMQSLKAFSQRLVNNPAQLQFIKNEKKCEMIEEQDESSDKENY